MNISSQIESNKTKTMFIITFFCLFIVMVAFLLGKAGGFGSSFVWSALILSGLMSMGSYFWGDRMILAISGAKEIDKNKEIYLSKLVEKIAHQSGIPMPKIYITEEMAPNAFATGRDPHHASICVTRGILETLEKTELEGVIAHEVSHIRNFDIRLMAIVSILVGTVSLLSDFFMRSLWFGGRNREREERNDMGTIFFVLGIIFALLSPLIATLIQLAISRKREFLADASGVLMTHNPDGLARALEKIARDTKVLKNVTHATAHLFIANPFKGKEFQGFLSSLFNTHPPIEERIALLRNMED